MDEPVEPASPATVEHRTGVSGELVERPLDVSVAIGVVRLEREKYPLEPELQAVLTGPGKRGILADLRTTHMQSHRMIEQAKHGELRAGWKSSPRRTTRPLSPNGAPVAPITMNSNCAVGQLTLRMARWRLARSTARQSQTRAATVSAKRFP